MTELHRTWADMKPDDPEPTHQMLAHLRGLVDEFVALCIRNERSGASDGLRANGLHQIADELGL